MQAMDRRLMNSTYMQQRIKDLYALHKATVEDYGGLVESLNKECDILVELLPSYKISPQLDESVRKKKEVHTVEKLEHELLTQYQRFLQLLRRLSKKNHPEQQALGSRLCARLIPAGHEFNNNDALLRLAVDFANAKASRVAQPCLKALQELLDGELVTEAAHNVVSAILEIVKKEKHALNPKLLATLLAVRVAMVDMHRPDIAEQKAKNKRMKKEDKELARQMMKGQARRDRAELAGKQTKMVHLMFVVYLRVLQASKSCTPVHQTKILAPALEGLAKFAPLVNVEHYHLLMTALRELVEDEASSVTTKLHALVAVACLAQKDASLDTEGWKTDLTFFHNVLFRCMPEVLTPPQPERVGDVEQRDRDAEEAERDGGGGGDKAETQSTASAATVGSLGSVAFSIAASMAHHKFVKEYAAREWSYRASILLRAIDLLVLMPKHLPPLRVQCFLRRMLQYAVQCPPHIALSLMATAHRLVLRYPSTASILVGGADFALVGRGVYNPGAEDLESCFPDAAFCWELPLLVNSYHPSVRQVASMMTNHYHKIAKHKPGAPPVVSPQLARLGPYELLQKFDGCLGDVQPPPRKPRGYASKHPLADAESAAAALATAAAAEEEEATVMGAVQQSRKIHRSEGGAGASTSGSAVPAAMAPKSGGRWTGGDDDSAGDDDEDLGAALAGTYDDDEEGAQAGQRAKQQQQRKGAAKVAAKGFHAKMSRRPSNSSNGAGKKKAGGRR